MAKSGYIVIAGRPNAGKSTLLNQVLGTQISIVTPKAQTTRERVLGILSEEENGQIVFVDTPGIHKAKEGGINDYMMREAKEAISETQLVWYIVDPDTKIQVELPVLDLLQYTQSPVFLLLNKADLKREIWQDLETGLIEAASARGFTFKKIFRISAKQGKGVRPLIDQSWAEMPEGPAFYPDTEQLSDRPTRFFVAEKIREQLLLQLGEEVPYSCAVEIERFLEDVVPIRIEAVIHVERDSQKGMVVGKGGLKIKAIGTKARVQIERFLGQKIFLGLRVKVLKDWTRDSEQLRKLGYHLPPKKA